MKKITLNSVVYQQEDRSRSCCNWKGVWSVLFLALLGSMGGLNAQTWSYMVAADDFGTTSGFHTYFGNGDGTFVSSVLSTGSITGAFATGDFSGFSGNHDSFMADFDNDGIADFLVATDDQGSDGFHVYLGNGNGTFAQTAISTLGVAAAFGNNDFAGLSNSHQGFVADFDNDGNTDYLCTVDDQGASSGFHVYLGNGNGTFVTSPLSTTGITPAFNTSDFAGVTNSHDGYVADFNNDGNIDYLVAADDYNASGGFYVYLGIGNGTFATTPIATVGVASAFNTGDYAGETNSHQCFVGDFTNDGNTDYFVAADDYNATGGFYIYVGNGDGTFATNPIATQSVVPVFNGNDYAGWTNSHDCFVADFNQDNNLDYLVVSDDYGSMAGFHVYFGTGIGTFNTSAVSTTSVTPAFNTQDLAGRTNNHKGFVFITSTPGVEICNDGIDNDGDGQIDCADGDCIGVPPCPTCNAGSEAPDFN